MMGHDYVEAPGKVATGDNPHETVMMLRCKWCNNTPAKAREDGCATHELIENGCIILSQFNPDGVSYWTGRKCITCKQEIMDHWLIAGGKSDYYCTKEGFPASEGITDCVWDVPDNLGVQSNTSGDIQ